MNAGFKILADRRILEIHRQVPKSGLCRQWADAPAPKRWEDPMIAESAIGRKKRCNLHGHTVFLPNRKTYSSLRLSSLEFTGFRAYKKQMTGIEPASSAWEADVLPMNYICMTYIIAYEFKKEKHFIHNNRISAERTRRCMDCPSEAARKLQLQF